MTFGILILTISFLAFSPIYGVAVDEDQEYPPPVRAMCHYVIDGDTIKCEIDGKVEKIRLIGVNAPERGEPGYREAKAYVMARCLDEELRLHFDKAKRDKYGRLLAYIFAPGSKPGKEIFINGALTGALRDAGYGIVTAPEPAGDDRSQ